MNRQCEKGPRGRAVADNILGFYRTVAVVLVEKRIA